MRVLVAGLLSLLSSRAAFAGQNHAGLHLSLSRSFLETLVATPVSDERAVNDIIHGVGVWGHETLTAAPRLRFRESRAAADICLDATAVVKAETYETDSYANLYRTTTSQVEGNKCLQLTVDQATAAFATAREQTTSMISRVEVKPEYSSDYDRAYRCTVERAGERRFDFERSRAQQAIWWMEMRLDSHPLMSWLLGGIVQAFFETFKVLEPGLHAGFSTSSERIAFDAESRAGTPAPPLETGDIELRTDASTVNTLAKSLAGMTLKDVTFAAEDPLIVSFDEQGFGITLRIAKMAFAGHSYENLSIHFKYKATANENGLVLDRVGAIDITPADDGLRDILGMILGENMTIGAIPLPLPNGHKIELSVSAIATTEGWLSLALKASTPQ